MSNVWLYQYIWWQKYVKMCLHFEKKQWSLISQIKKINPLYQMLLCAMFGSNRSITSGVFNVFFIMSLLSPFGKWRCPSYEQIWIPLTQWCFVPYLLSIGLLVLDKKINMLKVYNNKKRGTKFTRTSAQVS